MRLLLNFADCYPVALAFLLLTIPSKPVLAEPTYTTFDCPGVGSAQPIALNDNGVIAGHCGLYGFIRAADASIVTFSVSGADMTYVSGINGNGDVVGTYTFSGGTAQGYLRAADGTVTILDELYATAINDSGVITGVTKNEQGFVRDVDGTTTTFAVPNASQTYPEAINSSGEITGHAALNECCGILRGFVRTPGGKLIQFKAPGNVTEAYGINSHGDVTGSYGSGGFIRSSDGTITTFQVVKPRFLIYPAINDHRAIVGSYEKEEVDYPCDHGCTGFLKARDGTIRKIKVPVYGNAEPLAINNKGWIAGSYVIGGGGAPHGFIRTP